MADFTLDTSGFVMRQRDMLRTVPIYWSDLTPFEQGYVEAAFASLLRRKRGDANEGHVEKPMAGGRSYRAFGRFGDVAIGAGSREEALSEALRSRRGVTLADIDVWNGERYASVLAFSDLAPETLNAIRKDCAGLSDVYGDTAASGALFWADRQRGSFKGLNPQTRFPPLRLFLDDDGKLRFTDPDEDLDAPTGAGSEGINL